LPTTRLLLATGEVLEVEGGSRDVDKQLQDAARSSSGTLAWVTEHATGEEIAVNPAQVVMLRPGD
jgi:hypothetical protein